MSVSGNAATEVVRVLSDLSRYSSWEGGAARRLSECETVADLVARLNDEDVNVRLVAIQTLMACAELTDEDRLHAIDALTKLLNDDSVNEYSYDAFQAEQDEIPVRVSEAAARALQRLDPKSPKPR